LARGCASRFVEFLFPQMLAKAWPHVVPLQVNRCGSPAHVPFERSLSFERPAQASTSCWAAAFLGAASVGSRRLHRRCSLPCRYRQLVACGGLICRHASVTDSSNATIAALGASDAPDEDTLRKVFAEAAGGKDRISLDEAKLIPAVQGFLKDEAISPKEMQLIWGDAKELGFEDFSDWYLELVQIYDDFLWSDAVGIPREGLEEANQEKMADFTDEELLEDEPAMRQNVGEIIKQQEAEEKKSAGDEEEVPSLRSNVEITRLFKEKCDGRSLLDFDGLLEISEISEMLSGGEVEEAELEELWDGLPKVGDDLDYINILSFRDFLGKVDDLFDYDDGTAEKEGDGAMVAEKADRDVAEIKRDLLSVVAELQDMEDIPMGFSGREMTDEALEPLVEELENAWRKKYDDLNDFDGSELLGDWELIYTTSGKLRRWRTVLNANQEIKEATCGELLQSFSKGESGLTQEYDLEEVVTVEGEEELSLRAVGSWVTQLSENVISGNMDVLLRVLVQAVEYDTPEGEVKDQKKASLETQILRTFNYSFISYVDEDVRVMRPGLTGASVFIFQKLADVEES